MKRSNDNIFIVDSLHFQENGNLNVKMSTYIFLNPCIQHHCPASCTCGVHPCTCVPHNLMNLRRFSVDVFCRSPE